MTSYLPKRLKNISNTLDKLQKANSKFDSETKEVEIKFLYPEIQYILDVIYLSLEKFL